MKQFNLEEYLANPNKKVITRSGKSVRIISTNRLDNRYPVVAFIRLGDDYEDIWAFTKDGASTEHEGADYDLFFVPEKKEGWINLYKINSIINLGPRVYDTKEKAKSAIGDRPNYILTVKIEWEE